MPIAAEETGNGPRASVCVRLILSSSLDFIGLPFGNNQIKGVFQPVSLSPS